jgi:hypothetical protein
MRSEDDIQQMARHLQRLAQQYGALYEQATARGDRATADVAALKEVSYLSAAEVLGWALGELEANFEEADVVIVQPQQVRQGGA